MSGLKHGPTAGQESEAIRPRWSKFLICRIQFCPSQNGKWLKTMKDQNTESTVPEGQHECNRSEYNNYIQLRVIARAGLRKGPPQMFCPHLQQGFRGWRKAAPSITEGASKNENIYNSLFTENCIDKQMGKCLWLGTRIICGDWCFCDWSDRTKDIALSRPLRMRSKTKTIALKKARLNFAKEPEKKPENVGSTSFGQMKPK